MAKLLTIDLDAPASWPEELLRRAAAQLGSRGAPRRTRKGGTPPNPKPCPKCGSLYSGRAMREHIPVCTR